MAEKCYYCEKETKEVKEVYKQKSEEKTIIIKNTPMIYCNNCNEYFIDAKVSNNLDKIVEITKKQKANDKFLYSDNELIIIDYENIIKD